MLWKKKGTWFCKSVRRHLPLAAPMVAPQPLRRLGHQRPASIRRPAFKSFASPNRGPTSCRLVTGTVFPFTGIGIGIASAGFPAKVTSVVFFGLNTLQSNRKDEAKNGNLGGNF